MQLKRSTINESIAVAQEVISHFGMHLPAFAHWTPRQWEEAGSEYDEIRHCMLGWDVTDFGSKDFYNIGRTLFTVRNGKPENIQYPKEYAEKWLIDPENQRAPAHFHRSKREDIICPGRRQYSGTTYKSQCRRAALGRKIYRAGRRVYRKNGTQRHRAPEARHERQHSAPHHSPVLGKKRAPDIKLMEQGIH